MLTFAWKSQWGPDKERWGWKGSWLCKLGGLISCKGWSPILKFHNVQVDEMVQFIKGLKLILHVQLNTIAPSWTTTP
jgi:hypothetical protein